MIMVLDLKVPLKDDINSILALYPKFLAYVLRFIYVGIYYNNHHMFHTEKSIKGSILWANLFLLFCLSLMPVTTNFISEHHKSALPTFLYGFVLFMSAVAYYILQSVIIKNQGENSELKKAVDKDYKGKLSVVFYFLAIVISLKAPFIAQLVYLLIALVWLVPDKRIEGIFDL